MKRQGKIYTRKIIALVLGISERRVKQLTDEGIILEFSDGHYKLLPAVQGYIAYLKSILENKEKNKAVKSVYEMEREQLTRLKREDAELDIQVKRNELHRAADVEFVMTNMLVAFKAKLETLPYKVLSPITSVPEGDERAEKILDILKSAVLEAMETLAAYDPEQFDTEKYLAKLDEVDDGGAG